MKQITWNKSRGLTLTELLAVLMILSLLTTIAVPVFVSRQEDARVRVAMTECRELAQAQDMVAAMHGFYVPLQLLDELPPDDDDSVFAGDEERIDEHFNSNNIYLINATIRARDQFLQQDTLRYRLSDGDGSSSPENPLVRKLVDNWGGPFISFQRFWYDTRDASISGYSGPSDPDYRVTDDLFRDFPLDPWGNPYRFYSPIGVIGNGDDHEGLDFQFDNPDANFSNGFLTENDDDRFQRFAIVSYGRDGVADTDNTAIPDPDNTPDNDIFYEFGTDGLSRNFGRF